MVNGMTRRRFLGVAGLGLTGLTGCSVKNHYHNFPSETNNPSSNNSSVSNENILLKLIILLVIILLFLMKI